MTLATKIFNITRRLSTKVYISGPTGPYRILPYNENLASGVPGLLGLSFVKSYEAPVPVCTLRVNRIPSWLNRGATVTVDVGFDEEYARIFTGYVIDRAQGAPDSAEINCAGQLHKAFRSVEIAERSVDGLLVHTAIADILTYVGITDRRIEVSTFTLGTASTPVLERMLSSQMIQTLMDVEGWKISEYGTGVVEVRRVDGTPSAEAFRKYTTNVVATARIIGGQTREDPLYFRDQVIVEGATLVEGTPPNETSRTVTATATVVPATLAQPPLPDGSHIATTFSNHLIDTDAKAAEVAVRLATDFGRVPRQTTLELPGDPELELGLTLDLDFPELLLTGKYFIAGIRHEVDFDQGFVTQVDLRGGDEFGGTIGLAPIAAFDAFVEREVFGTQVYAFVTLDASASRAGDGGALTYDWGDNQATVWSPDLDAQTAKIVTIRVDPTAIVGDFKVTLIVTDATGRTATVERTIEVAATSSGVQIPAIFAALNNNAGASPDGGQNWNDQAGSTCISGAAKPPDGVNSGIAVYGFSDGSIKRTTDYCATALTQVMAAPTPNSPIRDIEWDWRDPSRVWALTDDLRLFVSSNDGISWSLVANFATALGLPPAGTNIATGSYVGNGSTRDITTVGFRPDVVIVFRDGRAAVVKGDDAVWGTGSVEWDGGWIAASGITAMLSNGFRVGGDTNVNANTLTHYFVAIKHDDIETGFYNVPSGGFPDGTLISTAKQPKMVWGFDSSATSRGVVKTSDMPTPKSCYLGAADVFDSGHEIKELVSAGFKIGTWGGTIGTMNDQFHTVYWIAFPSAVPISYGTYVGNGADDRQIRAGSYSYAAIMGDLAQQKVHHPSSLAGDSSHEISNTGALAANLIQSLNPFQVGSDARVNDVTGTPTYYYFLFGPASSVVGTGRHIGLPAAGGVWVYGGTGAGTPLIAYLLDGQVVGLTTGGELATDLPAASANLRIVHAVDKGDGGGLTIIMENADGGASGVRPIYNCVHPLQPLTWKRATGLDAGLTTGRYVVASDIPGRFFAAFDNQDVWKSNDGIAWTKLVGIMPAGVTPNHAIWIKDYIHSQQLQASVYIIAAENAGGTLGIYKSSDEFQTVGALRPATGFPAWPTSALGKQVAVGPPAAVRDQLLVVQSPSGSSPNTFERDTAILVGGVWVKQEDGASTSQDVVDNVKKLGSNHYRILSITNNNNVYSSMLGQLQRSTDGGFTWSNVGPSPQTSGGAGDQWGVSDMDIAADGTLWLCATAVQSADTTRKPQIYKSTDDGATWTLVFTESTISTSNYECMWHISCHPLNAQIIGIQGDTAIAVMRYWITQNGGTSFARKTGSAGQSVSRNYVSIMWDNGRVLHFRSESAYLSDDYGTSWVLKHDETLFSNGQFCMAMIRGLPGGHAFAVGGSAGSAVNLIRTRDYGETFEELTDENDFDALISQLIGLAYNPVQDTLYISTVMNEPSGTPHLRVFALDRARTITPSEITSATFRKITLNLDGLFNEKIAHLGIALR